MELADIYVINKCDLPGAEKLAAEIRRVQALTARNDTWAPPVVLTSLQQPETTNALSAAIDAHQQWLDASKSRDEVIAERARYRLKLQLERRVDEIVDSAEPSLLKQPLAEQFETALARISVPPDSGPARRDKSR